MKEGHTPEPGATQPLGYSLAAANIVEDPTLSVYAYRVYGIISLHDYGRGAGCYLSRSEIAHRGKMSEAQVKRSLAELRTKGYISTADMSRDGKSTNRHFRTDTGLTQSPLPSIEAQEAGEGGSHRAPRGADRAPTGLTQSPKVDNGEVDELSRQATSHDVAAPRDAREAQGRSEQRDEEAAPELGQGDGDPAAAAAVLCGTLAIAATATNIRAMGNVIRDKAPQCHRALEDVALEAAGYLDSHRKKQRSVAFFRNWVDREIAGPGSSSRGGGNGHGHGGYRVAAGADVERASAAARSRDAVYEQRKQRHIEQYGSLTGWE